MKKDPSTLCLEQLIKGLQRPGASGAALVGELIRRLQSEPDGRDGAAITAEFVRILIHQPNSRPAEAIFEALRLEWRRRLRSKYRGLVDVDDVVQEALLRLVAALGRRGFGPNKNFWGYAYRMCANVVFDRFKRKELVTESIDAAAQEPVDPAPSWEDDTIRVEEAGRSREHLERVLDTFENTVGRRERKIVEDYFFVEGTRAEVAQHRRDLAARLGCTGEVLRQWISRWLPTLRWLEDQQDADRA